MIKRIKLLIGKINKSRFNFRVLGCATLYATLFACISLSFPPNYPDNPSFFDVLFDNAFRVMIAIFGAFCFVLVRLALFGKVHRGD